MMMQSASWILNLMLVVALTAPCRAEEPIRLVFREAPMHDVAGLYSRLTGKKVAEISSNIAERPVTIDTGSATLTREQAIRFIDATLYVQGIETQTNLDGSVSFVQYAVIDAPAQIRRRIIKGAE